MKKRTLAITLVKRPYGTDGYSKFRHKGYDVTLNFDINPNGIFYGGQHSTLYTQVGIQCLLKAKKPIFHCKRIPGGVHYHEFGYTLVPANKDSVVDYINKLLRLKQKFTDLQIIN